MIEGDLGDDRAGLGQEFTAAQAQIAEWRGLVE
jgi:hypothetical protein